MKNTITAAQAASIVNDVRLILYRETGLRNEPDTLDPNKPHDLESLDYIVGVMEEYGLAPTAVVPLVEVTLEAEAEVAPVFSVGQLVSVDWERLGEVAEILPGGYYRVWVEGDDRLGPAWHTVHQHRMEVQP